VDYRADVTGTDGVQEIGPVPPPDLADGDGIGEGGRFESEEGSGSMPELEVGPDGEIPGDLPCGGLDNLPFTSELTDDDFVITIPSDSVIRDSDATLRITTSGDVDDRVAGLDVAFSVGDIDCGFGSATVDAPAGNG
jgi:hypothetical protein